MCTVFTYQCPSGIKTSLQHAELTDDFKRYLEKQGLHEVELASKLVWVVFGGLCKFQHSAHL